VVISRTPRRQDKSEEDEMQFEQPDRDASWLNGGENPAIPEKDERDEKITKLEQALADLHSKMDDNAQDRLLTTVTTQQQRQVFTPDQEVAIPDLDADLNGHIAAVAKNAEIRARNEFKRKEFDRSQGQDVESKTQALWDTFEEKYSELAEGGQNKVEFAAMEVAKRARSRGIDVEKYMFVTTDRFLKDVAKEYVKTFGEPEGDEEEDDDFIEESRSTRKRAASRSSSRNRPSKRRNRDRQEDDDGDGRSTVFGGNDSGGRMSPRDDGDSRDMIDDFHDMQRKTGFF
jgi:hypothetical protein